MIYQLVLQWVKNVTPYLLFRNTVGKNVKKYQFYLSTKANNSPSLNCTFFFRFQFTVLHIPNKFSMQYQFYFFSIEFFSLTPTIQPPVDAENPILFADFFMISALLLLVHVQFDKKTWNRSHEAFFTVHISGMKRAESFIRVEKNISLLFKVSYVIQVQQYYLYITFLVSFRSIHIRQITQNSKELENILL